MNTELYNKYINDAVFVVVDVETTGQNAYNGRITEIGMVKVIDGEIVDEYSTLINPEQFIPPYITFITGITNEMVSTAPTFYDVHNKIKSFLGDNVFVAHNVSFDFFFVKESFLRVGEEEIKNDTLCTVRLARRILPTTKSKSLDSLIKYYNIPVNNRHRALDDAKATAKILINFLDVLENKYDIELLSDVLSFQYKKVFQLKNPPKNFLLLKNEIANLPEKPGVYFFYDKNDFLLYIGKSKNLKERVESYFYHNTGHDSKIFEMVRKVHSLKYETTASELSALLLESLLIKKYKPLYNSASKRYKKYPFLKINVNEKYPVLSWDYEIKDDGAKYYGPFTNRYSIEVFLEALNKLFKLRECKDFKPKAKRSCIYSDIERCLAPCINDDYEKYEEEIKNVFNFLNGMNKSIIDKFVEMMNDKAENLLFEEAAEIRNKIWVIEKFIEKHKYLPYSINDANFLVVVPSFRKSFEIFLIKNSKLIRSIYFESYQKKQIDKFLDEIINQADLFDVNYTKKDFHEFHIIMSWVYKNRNMIEIIDLNEKSKKDIHSQIISFLNSF